MLITWALLGNYDFGSTGTLTIGGFAGGAVPRKADLPSEDDWGQARVRAGANLGIAPEHNRTARAVLRFATQSATRR